MRRLPNGWRLSGHAMARAMEMDLDEADIVQVLEDSEVSYPQPKYGPDNEMRQRGELALAVNARTRVVITILWRKTDQWTREQFRDRDTKEEQ